MKQWIRKWLGIIDPPAPIETTHLRGLTAQAIIEALECEGKDQDARIAAYRGRWTHSPESITRSLRGLIVSECADQLKDYFESAGRLEKMIKNEAFIDELVARIKKKQLP